MATSKPGVKVVDHSTQATAPVNHTSPTNIGHLPVPAIPKATAPAGVVDPISKLPTAQRNAYASLKTMLDQYGLGTLAPKLLSYVQQGYANDGLSYLLQQTPEYKKRFVANDTRIKNGLAPLSPAEYLATERSYRDVLRSSGLPAGFYDSPSDFQNLISNDISATELKDRADNAFKFAQNNVDPNVKQALQSYYGVTDSHLAAYFLDPKAGEALLDRQARAAEIGGAAKTNGLQVARGQAESLADQGISYAQAQQGSSNAGLIKQDVLQAAQRFGSSYNESDLVSDELGGLASARRKRQQLASSEAGLFAGSAGSLGQTSANPGGSF